MSQFKKVAVLLGVFFLGCAAERLTAVRPAQAEMNAHRWEYACKQLHGDEDDIARKANLLGQQGWEIATLLTAGGREVSLCFKRALP
ncbi:MAG TPA: hypothetical protein VGY54_09180 [Polyangiaceae bacterium]|jgi:hypothetical protein|nr:hypothetical protein [Polyangiaceae bacterium]